MGINAQCSLLTRKECCLTKRIPQTSGLYIRACTSTYNLWGYLICIQNEQATHAPIRSLAAILTPLRTADLAGVTNADTLTAEASTNKALIILFYNVCVCLYVFVKLKRILGFLVTAEYMRHT
jgi:hypothetical protein